MLKGRWIFILSLVMVALGLQGCMESVIRPVSQAAGPCIGGAPGNVSGFNVNVSGFRWVDQVMRPGYENVPKAQIPAAYGSLANLKPQLSFLAVNLKITNTSKSPIAWNNPTGGYSFRYQLVNAQGTRYGYSQEVSSILYKTSMNNLNPGVPVEGTVVFDVPSGDYTFTVIKDQLLRSSMFSRTFGENVVFQCSLGS